MKKATGKKHLKHSSHELNERLLEEMLRKDSANARKLSMKSSDAENARKAKTKHLAVVALEKANHSLAEVQKKIPSFLEMILKEIPWALAPQGDDAVAAINGQGGKVFPLSHHGSGNLPGTLCIAIPLSSRRIVLTRLQWSVDGKMMYHQELADSNGNFSYVDQTSILDQLRSYSTPYKLVSRLAERSAILKESHLMEMRRG